MGPTIFLHPSLLNFLQKKLKKLNESILKSLTFMRKVQSYFGQLRQTQTINLKTNQCTKHIQQGQLIMVNHHAMNKVKQFSQFINNLLWRIKQSDWLSINFRSKIIYQFFFQTVKSLSFSKSVHPWYKFSFKL